MTHRDDPAAGERREACLIITPTSPIASLDHLASRRPLPPPPFVRSPCTRSHGVLRGAPVRVLASTTYLLGEPASTTSPPIPTPPDAHPPFKWSGTNHRPGSPFDRLFLSPSVIFSAPIYGFSACRSHYPGPSRCESPSCSFPFSRQPQAEIQAPVPTYLFTLHRLGTLLPTFSFFLRRAPSNPCLSRPRLSSLLKRRTPPQP